MENTAVNQLNIIAVLPAYNEERHIGAVVRAARPFVTQVIVVDDCSRDATFAHAQAAGAAAFHHAINLGKAAALKTGARAALQRGADIIVFMDSDGQHRPEDIPRMLEPLRTGEADVVFASRKGGDRMPIVRYMGNRLLQVTIKTLFHIDVQDIQCGFRAFKSDVFPRLEWDSKNYHADAEITARTGLHGLRYREIFIETIYHDSYKGMTVIDGLKLLFNIIVWKFKL